MNSLWCSVSPVTLCRLRRWAGGVQLTDWLSPSWCRDWHYVDTEPGGWPDCQTWPDLAITTTATTLIQILVTTVWILELHESLATEIIPLAVMTVCIPVSPYLYMRAGEWWGCSKIIPFDISHFLLYYFYTACLSLLNSIQTAILQVTTSFTFTCPELYFIYIFDFPQTTYLALKQES